MNSHVYKRVDFNHIEFAIPLSLLFYIPCVYTHGYSNSSQKGLNTIFLFYPAFTRMAIQIFPRCGFEMNDVYEKTFYVWCVCRFNFMCLQCM